MGKSYSAHNDKKHTCGQIIVTTIRLDETDDELLERIRAKLILMGKKVTKKEILGRLIREDHEKLDLINDAELHDAPPLFEDPAWKMLSSPISWGISDTSTTVDEYLYSKN